MHLLGMMISHTGGFQALASGICVVATQHKNNNQKPCLASKPDLLTINFLTLQFIFK